MKPSILVSFAALPARPYIHLHPLPHRNLHQFLSVYSRTYPQMIFNYMPAHPFLSLSISLVWLSFCLPALSEQTFNLLTGPVKAFLITKVAALSLPWPASPPRHTTASPSSPCQSASQAVYDESHLAFAWFALFIYSSILSDCLAVSLFTLSLSISHSL